MKITKNIIISDDGLALFLDDIKSLVIADLHIGLELALMDEGTFLPIEQYSDIKGKIMGWADTYNPERIIINGDFKHEFGRASRQEWTEILDLWDTLVKRSIGLDVVRGNHDNYLITVLKKRDKELRDPSYVLGRYFFTHGHKDIEIPRDIEVIVIAHEHPAIILRDDTGGRHKFKCLLHGVWEDNNVIVLPALSPLSGGSVVNSRPQNKLFSPFLRKIDMDSFVPIVMDKSKLLKFPTLGEMDQIDDREEWDDKLFY
jgi:putative SbcD/Mre11-related phosphoesterase